MFGTKMADEFFPIHTGGDVAFVNGVLKHLLAIGGIDRRFVTEHTTGFDALLAELEDEPFDVLEADPRARRAHDMARVRAHVRRRATSAVLVWSMGVTQHESGVDNVRAIVNLGLRAATSAGPARAYADPRALRRAGRRRDGLLRDDVPRRRRDQRGDGGRPRRAVGLRRSRATPGSPRPRWSTPRAAAISTCCGRAAATSSTCCPRPTSAAPRSRARRCACTRTSC